jgi:amidase
MTACEIAAQVRSGGLSPGTLVQAVLDRIATVNPAINAVVTLAPRALDDARRLEHRIRSGDDPGPLAGVPVGIKDVTPVAGLRTTYGSALYADHVPTEDAVIVQRLRAAGAIVIGKTNTPEFAAGGNTWNDVFGGTRNPWNLERSAGGSTGGGAAALATGMIAIAEGTDLGGSLRIPAAFCGVVGLRPSVGLVPTHPSGWAWDTLQVSGPMGRTAEDVALALEAMAGPSPWAPPGGAPRTRDFLQAARSGPPAGARVAYCADPVGIGVDPGIVRVCRDAVDALAASGTPVDEVPLDLADGREAFLALRGLWFVNWMHADLHRIDQLGPNVRNNVNAGLAVTTRDLAAAERTRAGIWHRFRELFQKYDYLLTPTMAVPPFPVDQNYPETVAGRKMSTYVDWIAPTFVLSLTGLPIASVPAGLDADRMPVGLQIVGRPAADGSVLGLAARLQELRPIGAPPVAPA